MSTAETDRSDLLSPRLGAIAHGDRTRFSVLAPGAQTVEVEVRQQVHALHRDDHLPEHGLWSAIIDDVGHGDRYRLRVDRGDWLADPASRWQPNGAHGPSAVLDQSRFVWSDDDWHGVGLEGAVFYELNIGAFTTEGTLDSAIGQLDRLRAVGFTALQILPVTTTVSSRGWDQDGAFPFAVDESYGGPESLARFVEAAHREGLAVMLDLPYERFATSNESFQHFLPHDSNSPDGTDLSHACMRRYIVENALGWIHDYHVDGLRLDAGPPTGDPATEQYVTEVSAAVHATENELDRAVLITIESDIDDRRAITPIDAGGHGCDAIWDRDVHHALRVAISGDERPPFRRYTGVPDIAAAWRGDRPHAEPPFRIGPPDSELRHHQFIVCSVNHGDIGNIPRDERLRANMDVLDPRRRLAVASILLSPFTPMIFMGQEYGERPPKTLDGESPLSDPLHSGALDPSVAVREPHRPRLAMYTELIRLRRHHEVLTASATPQEVTSNGAVITVTRWGAHATATLCFNFSDELVGREAEGAVVFDSDDHAWGGPGRRRDLIGPWSARLELAS